MELEKQKILKQKLSQAEAVVIGTGAGMSAAAGLLYSGERFEKNFKDFIERYGLKDIPMQQTVPLEYLR